jgi:hypothetical protein
VAFWFALASGVLALLPSLPSALEPLFFLGKHFPVAGLSVGSPSEAPLSPLSGLSLRDLDLSTTTDSEDLLVFAADLLEFGVQDPLLALDAGLQVGSLAAFALLTSRARQLSAWLLRFRV